MHRDRSPSIQKSAITAGIGSVTFSILTMAALMASNSPGGNYTPSQVTNYLAHGHRTPAIPPHRRRCRARASAADG